MVFLDKKYKLISSENFENFLKAADIEPKLRNVANAVTPTVTLRQDGDSYALVTLNRLKTTEVKFKPGEEVEEERADGSKVKSVFTFDRHNVLKQVQKCPDGLEITYIREFGPEEMKSVVTCKDVTATRVYKKKPEH